MDGDGYKCLRRPQHDAGTEGRGNGRPQPPESDQRHGLLGYLGPDPAAEDIRIVTAKHFVQYMFIARSQQKLKDWCCQNYTICL